MSVWMAVMLLLATAAQALGTPDPLVFNRQFGIGDLSAMALSPDGTKIATTSIDATLRIWDAATGQLLQTCPYPKTYFNMNLEKLQLHFSPDGTKLLLLGSGIYAALCDSQTGQWLWTLTDQNQYCPAVEFAVFSPDGKKILSGSMNDPEPTLIDAQTGRILNTFTPDPSYQTWHCNAVAISPDGKKAVANGWASGQTSSGVMFVWDMATGQLQHIIPAISDWPQILVFSPDGSKIAAHVNRQDGTGSWATDVHIWDFATGTLQQTFQIPGEGHYFSEYMSHRLAFSPDGKQILTGGNHTARLFDLATSQTLQTFSNPASINQAVSFVAGKPRVLTYNNDAAVQLWDFASPQAMQTITAHMPGIYDIQASPDGTKFLTSHYNNDSMSPYGGSVRLWDIGTSQPLRTMSNGTPAIFAPDGQSILTRGPNNTAQRLDITTGKVLATYAGHTGPIDVLAFAQNGARIVTGSEDRTARIWDATTSKTLWTLGGNAGPVYNAAISADGKRVLTLNLNPSGHLMMSTTTLWAADTGTPLKALPIKADVFTFSPDGSQFLVGDANGYIHCFSSITGDELYSQYDVNMDSGHLRGMAFTPDRSKLILFGIGWYYGFLDVWAPDMKRSLFVHDDYNALIRAFAFSQKNAFIGFADGTIKLYDFKTAAREWRDYE